MKKLLIIFLLTIFTGSLFAQTGSGWKPIRAKQNFKDSTYFQYAPLYSAGAEIEIQKVMPMQSDTSNISFSVGIKAAGDTACFRTAYIMGAFDSFVSDTLIVDSMRVTLQGTTPDIDIQMYYDDNLHDATPTAVFTASLTVTSTTTGNGTSAITNGEIPPGKKCYFKLTEVTVQPIYMLVTLFYHTRNLSY